MPIATSTHDFVQEECINCGIIYFITRTFQTWRKDDKKTFYCPNGHGQVYSKSVREQLREMVARKQSEITRLEQELRIATTKKTRTRTTTKTAKKA